MTISIWIIFILIVGVGFWFYYKKNKPKLKNTSVNTEKKQTKYTLTNIDQMLNHVTQKENEVLKLKSDIDNSAEKQEEEKVQESKQQEKSTFDFKNGIIASMILKKKDER